MVDDRADPAVVGVGRAIHEHPLEGGQGVVGVRVLGADGLDHGEPVAHPRPAAVDRVLDAVEELEAGRHLPRREVGVLTEVEARCWRSSRARCSLERSRRGRSWCRGAGRPTPTSRPTKSVSVGVFSNRQMPCRTSRVSHSVRTRSSSRIVLPSIVGGSGSSSAVHIAGAREVAVDEVALLIGRAGANRGAPGCRRDRSSRDGVRRRGRRRHGAAPSATGDVSVRASTPGPWARARSPGRSRRARASRPRT